MRIRLRAWYDSRYGLHAPDEEIEVETEEGVRLCASHMAEPVRSVAVEVAVLPRPERAVKVRPKRKRAKR